MSKEIGLNYFTVKSARRLEQPGYVMLELANDYARGHTSEVIVSWQASELPKEGERLEVTISLP